MAATAPALQQDDVAPVFPRRRRRNLGVYGLLVPAAILMAVALGYPLVRQFVISFQEYGLRQQFGQPAEWVGLQNYTDLLDGPLRVDRHRALDRLLPGQRRGDDGRRHRVRGAHVADRHAPRASRCRWRCCSPGARRCSRR